MAAQALKDSGAVKVSAYCTHPVLSGLAVDNIQQSVLDELVVTDTLLLNDAAKACRKIRQISLAGLLSESIRRINGSESLSSMFPE
jgi:ribose-phosphate pyrophosphokinase